MNKAARIILYLICGLITFVASGFILAFSSAWPVDSTLSFSYVAFYLFLPRIAQYFLISLGVGVVIFIVSRIGFSLLLKEKQSRSPLVVAVLSTLIITLVTSTGSISFWYSDLSEIKAVVLKTGRLSQYPKTASEFKLGKRGGLFSVQSYVVFNAPQKDIEKFLVNSPGLKKPEILTPKNIYTSTLKSARPVFSWFDTETINHGRLFRDYQYPEGVVVAVDDEKNKVYIEVSHGYLH